MIAPFLDLLFLKGENDYLEKMAKGQPELKLSMGSLIENFYYYLTNTIVEEGKEHTLVLICVLVVILFFLKNMFKYFAMFFLAPLRNHVVKDLRQNLFDKTLVLPLSFFSEEKKGDIMARMTSDVHEIEWSIMATLEVIFRDPFSIILYLFALVFMSPQLTLFVFVLFPIAGFLIARIGKSLKRTTNRSREQFGGIMAIIEESLGGLRIIKAFTSEKTIGDKFRNQNLVYTNTMIRMYRKIDLSSPMSEFLGTVVLVIVMYFGGKLVLVQSAQLPASLFITYIAVFSQIIPPARALTNAYYNIQRGISATERVSMILEAPEIITDNAKSTEISELKESISYKNVSFAYSKGDDGYALKNVSLTIKKGKTIALVGQSGSGKSTFADLLARFYDCSGGGIFIDNQNIKDIKLNSLRGILGIVSQESILFNDTIYNNIAFGKENATESQIMEAAKIANAHEFILETPNGYQTNIGDKGGKLSGGQKQRISIARAVLKNPDILILDEATSALDTESERLVQDALEKLLKNRTSIVIAHRLSTIVNADEIIVLNKGEILERGTHKELLELNSAYKKLYDMQIFNSV
jgi:subfamily B ATP-binding cassette protein MsbA